MKPHVTVSPEIAAAFGMAGMPNVTVRQPVTVDASIKPTDRQLIDWWQAQPFEPHVCSGCGAVGQKAVVQPQHPYYARLVGVALCGSCIGRKHTEAKAERKAQLAALPRCTVPGCKARGNLKHNGTLICGRHWKVAKRNVFGAAGGTPIGMFTTIRLNRAQLIDAATRED